MLRSRRPSQLICLAVCAALALASCFRAGSGTSPWAGGSGGTSAEPATAFGTTGTSTRPAAAVKMGTALLIRGSERERGLPFLGQNALETLTGRYALSDENGGALELDVWYCAEALIIPASWSARACTGLPAGLTLRAAPPEPALGGVAKGRVLWVLEASSYRIFISLPDGFADSCRFAAALGERFDWFRRYAALPSDLSFPALLEYR